MPEYVCVDGPLSGHGFEWAEGRDPGQTLTIAVVDVGQPEVAPEEEPEADYRIERVAHGEVPGRLHFVAGRGSWRAAGATPPLLEV